MVQQAPAGVVVEGWSLREVVISSLKRTVGPVKMGVFPWKFGDHHFLGERLALGSVVKLMNVSWKSMVGSNVFPVEKGTCLEFEKIPSRCWFRIFFYVHPYLGKISNLTIFQRGGSTTQLVTSPLLWMIWNTCSTGMENYSQTRGAKKVNQHLKKMFP